MSTISLSKNNQQQFFKEFDIWKKLLNKIGIFAFTIAMACLLSGNRYVHLVATLTLVVVFIWLWSCQNQFPSFVTRLRKKRDKNVNEKITLRGIEGTYFDLKNILLNFHIFGIGLVSLVFVAFIL